ncbi:hypothetical protein KCP76_14655 [Salmonella enterica subsp. enterica serovar Weltevreden]|nr:hypothetical protein KCP76_14655 [Salmonella enterica subsp. enterica serovar Weltevreden]
MIWINAGQCLQPDWKDGNPNGFKPVNADGDYSAGLSGMAASDEEGSTLPAGMKGFPACYLTTTLTASGDMLNMMTAMNMTHQRQRHGGANLGAWRVCARTGSINHRHENDSEDKDTLFQFRTELPRDWKPLLRPAGDPAVPGVLTLGEGSLESDIIFDGFLTMLAAALSPTIDVTAQSAWLRPGYIRRRAPTPKSP